MIFFTADTHFGHKNIIKYCNRPFASIEEMDENLISNINDRVKHNDTLYHLGDFAFGHLGDILWYRKRLYCQNVILICGSHDRVILNNKDMCCLQPCGFQHVYEYQHYLIMNTQGIDIFLCHYAHRVWHKSHYNSYHAFGHSHGLLPSLGHSIDVGVDAHCYCPISLNEFITKVF